jgi:hypothetical protein
MEYLHSLLSLLNCTHGDEPKPTALASLSVINDLHIPKVKNCVSAQSKNPIHIVVTVLSSCLTTMLLKQIA